MDRDEIKQKARQTAETLFKDYPWERPFPTWRHFDSGLADELFEFISGQVYSREKIPHTTRQMVAVAALTSLQHLPELRQHLWAALNVGCKPGELAEVIFQTGIYAGMPTVNQALAILREVVEKHPACQDQPE